MRLKVFRGESRDLVRIERDVNAFAKKIEGAGGTWNYSYTLYGEKVMFTVSYNLPEVPAPARPFFWARPEPAQQPFPEWFDESSAKS